MIDHFSRISFKKLLFTGLLLAGLLCLLPFLGEPGLADPKTAGMFGLWVAFLGTLHPVFLHLPIGAFLVVSVLELVGCLSRGRINVNSLIPLTFSLVTALLAAVFGYALYLTGSYTGELIERHKIEGLVFCGLLICSLLLKIAEITFRDKQRALKSLYLLSLVGGVALMTLAGHHGGMITHGDPMDKLPPVVLAEREAVAEAVKGDPVIYQHVVQPILQERCVYCHGSEKQEGHYRMDSYAALLSAGDEGTGLVPGDLEGSGIISRMHLPHNDDHHMPPSDKPQPTAEETALIEWWVAQGANEFSKKSELERSPEVELALANLVSPLERKERDKKRREEAQAERKHMLAEKEQLRPALAEFDQVYPGALQFISSEKADLWFNGISYVKSFGPSDLEKLLPFAAFLRKASFTMTQMDDGALSVLSTFSGLRELNVSQTVVSDAFVAGLTNLMELKVLNLYGTKITSESSVHLQKLPALQTLFLGETGYDAEQTVVLRNALASNSAFPVEVIGVDELPNLEMLSEGGALAFKAGEHPERYGVPIATKATVTLSSNDKRYRPAGGLAQFIAAKDSGMEFAFHSQNEKKPWVQLSYDQPHRISAFNLRNRETLPERAAGLALERLQANGSWETLWNSSAALKSWVVDLSDLPEEKRESMAFRFINLTETETMLHLSHLRMWGQPMTDGPESPVESGDLDIAGQDPWSYVVAPHWGHLPEQEEIGPTHGGIVVDRAGRVYVSTDGPHGILVYRRDGTLLTRIAQGQGHYHGLCIHSEEGQEFIYAAANSHIAKYTLSGEEVLKIEGGKQPEANRWAKATAVAVAPNGDLFIADGYGSSVIFKYNAQGAFIKKFGSRGNAAGQFITSHGLAVDNRNPEKPLLVVCDRENRRLQHFDMEGNFVQIAIEGLRRPCSVAIWNDLLLVAELAGRAVLLDRDYKIVSILGDNPRTEERANFHVHPDDWEEGVFTAPHGCAFDAEGNLYIQDWNKWGRVTKLLLKSRLDAEDVTHLSELKKHAELLHAVERSPNGWSPDKLKGLSLWLDADDLSTITAASGRVSQWDDKSASGFHAHALSPNERPYLGAVRLNGKNALELKNSRLASKVPQHGDWRDVFVVAKWDGGAQFKNFNGLLTGFGGSLGIIGNSRGRGTGLYIPETWWKTLKINGEDSDGAEVMSILAKPFMASITTDAKTDVAGFSIGSDRQFTRPRNQRFWEGVVCEVIGFNRNLNDVERQQVEGYLAHKWGLIATLPEEHPYKTKQP